MSFVKAFAHMGIWKDVYLNDEQEGEVESNSRKEHKAQMIECISDAKDIIRKSFPGGDVTQTIYTTIAVALFDKRVSHLQYHRERLAKEIFDKMVSK